MVAALLSDELMNKDNPSGKEVNNSLLANADSSRGRSAQRGKGNRNRSKSRGKGVLKCFYCNKEGHFKRDCMKMKDDLAKKQGDNNDQAGVVEDGNDNGDLLNVSDGVSAFTDSWVLDSGCSFHMSPNKHWFYDYKELDGGTVLMGNDASCKTVGIGTIKIRMHDGIVRILEDVRYVPELRKNLISLGCLDAIGCKITLNGGELKVAKGAMIIMKGQKFNCLYRLQGSTIIGGAAVSFQSIDKQSYTILWHMRLDHISEKGISELHRRNLLKGLKTCSLNFCKYCVFGKQTKVQFKNASHTTKQILDYVHTDV